jgi:DNA-binding response OmpR family regulator
MVVDDEDDIAETNALMLTIPGREARIAISGQQALELAPVFKPATALAAATPAVPLSL